MDYNVCNSPKRTPVVSIKQAAINFMNLMVAKEEYEQAADWRDTAFHLGKDIHPVTLEPLDSE